MQKLEPDILLSLPSLRHTLWCHIFEKENKNVLLMSTQHKKPAVGSSYNKMPNIFLDFNRNKGAVDNLDKRIGAYCCKRMTRRWPLVVFFNVLDVSAYHAFVVWTEVNPDWNKTKFNKRRLFLEELGKALVSPQIEMCKTLAHSLKLASAGMVREKQGANLKNIKKRCKECNPKNVKTRFVCQTCDKYICKAHAVVSTYCHLCA